MQTFPEEFAGVGGSFVQVLFQVGAAIGNAAQAGFLTSGDGTLADWTGSRNSFFFTSGVIAASGIIFAVWFRHDKMPQSTPLDETPAEGEQVVRDVEATENVVINQ